MGNTGTGRLVILLKRAYDPPAAADGPRVLVDRLWPRGVSRARLRIDAWLRDVAPTVELCTWFGHDPTRWEAFRRRYRAELKQRGALLRELGAYARRGRLTLVYGARDPDHNQAVVLREALGRVARSGSQPGAARRARP